MPVSGTVSSYVVSSNVCAAVTDIEGSDSNDSPTASIARQPPTRKARRANGGDRRSATEAAGLSGTRRPAVEPAGLQQLRARKKRPPSPSGGLPSLAAFLIRGMAIAGASRDLANSRRCQ
jgi:hypothetical protein